VGRPRPAQHGARAQQGRVLRLLPRDSEYLERAPRETRGAGLASDTAAGTSHRGRALKGRGVSSTQRFSARYGLTATSAARRARAATSSAAPPVKTQLAPACATRDTRRWLGVGRRSWHVAPRSCAKGERPLVGTAPFHKAQADHNQRGTAGARSKFECCASFPEIASAGTRAQSVTRGAGLALVATAGTSHHGRRRREHYRWRSTVVQDTSRPQPAPCGAQAQQARVPL
jgi:hypothetical protein